ncbi:MAG: cupin domain-containing protein [Parvibaculum sp.]|jgi:transcriptional regulator with XRE-family HTH domain|uniref:cupin domain-containing protein n=1 Tax=Parvibaculum sp. TaxID=2024848 RepID=UPI0028412C57|nr:cupin domain-containing protein [Parvibaculum sp.]MDR3499035.1 cupin domain-containing protein [Parvibaculum sp.]
MARDAREKPAGDFRRAHGGAHGPALAEIEGAAPDIGARLRELRTMHGLSQRELAKRAGVTNGTISLIEQNRISPSMGSLKKVLDGFPISMADFLTLELKPRSKVFYQAKELREIGGGPISFKLVGRDMRGRAIQMMHERYQPGADTGEDMLSHAGEECGIVVSGLIELTVGGETRRLTAGDAYYFDSRLPHRWRNTGTIECVIVSACTPPSF